MICPARDILKLASNDPFAQYPSGPDIIRFVNVLHKRPNKAPCPPLCLPSEDGWVLRVIAIQGRFVLGLYRRQMKAIGYLGKIEKLLGVPATDRKSTRLNSSHVSISYAVFCLKKKMIE